MTKRAARAAKTPGAGKGITVERHTEVIRQWQLLRAVEGTVYGKTVQELAGQFHVTTRTIRRDIDALMAAGFPLDKRKTDSGVRWQLDRHIFRGLTEAGLTLPELCALYFSRALVEFMAGTPFHQDLATAFDKLEDALNPKMKRYLDGMPGILTAKSAPKKKRGAKHATSVATLFTAILEHRTVNMRYYSFHSQKERDYVVEPYRLAFAEGGLYLFAYVPAYGQMRTFAVERARSVGATDTHFNPTIPLSPEAFGESLGVNSGKAEAVTVQFTPAAAPHVLERTWHRSQKTEKLADGSVIVRLNVCVDFALQAWILSFGPLVQVIEPKRLAERIYEQLEEARDHYFPRLSFEPVETVAPRHPALPFRDTPRRSSTPMPS